MTFFAIRECRSRAKSFAHLLRKVFGIASAVSLFFVGFFCVFFPVVFFPVVFLVVVFFLHAFLRSLGGLFHGRFWSFRSFFNRGLLARGLRALRCAFHGLCSFVLLLRGYNL